MEQQWQLYGDPSINHPARFAAGSASAPLQAGRDAGGQNQQHYPPAGYAFDSHQPMPSGSNSLSISSTPAVTPHAHDYTGEIDVHMEDADPYNRAKYPSRPAHQHRASTQYLGHEASSASQRYSPMNVLSPTVPYSSSPNSQSQNAFSYQNQNSSSRHTPTRQNHLTNVAQQYQESPSTYSLWVG